MDHAGNPQGQGSSQEDAKRAPAVKAAATGRKPRKPRPHENQGMLSFADPREPAPSPVAPPAAGPSLADKGRRRGTRATARAGGVEASRDAQPTPVAGGHGSRVEGPVPPPATAERGVSVPVTPRPPATARPNILVGRSLLAPNLGTRFVCYDSETTDKEVRHAQILQFAVVEADRNLCPLKERTIVAKRLPYIVPSPQALGVTGFDVATLDDEDRPDEFDVARSIHNLLRPEPGIERVYLTFNGIKFDDEVLRGMLFRNLLDPFVMSKGNTTRMDVYNLVNLTTFASPGTLNLPPEIDGAYSRKLQDICQANNIEIKAHDALGDTRATLQLAKYIQEGFPLGWRKLLEAGRGVRMDARLGDAAREGEVAWVFSPWSGGELIPCSVIGTDNKKRWLVADLRFEDEDFPDTVPDMDAFLCNPHEKPLRTVKANAAPVVFWEEELSAFRNLVLDPVKFRVRADRFREMAQRNRQYLADFSAMKFEEHADPSSEERIYGGFPDKADEAAREDFHRLSSWAERARVRFRDPRLVDFAARLVLRHADEAGLDAESRSALATACADAYERPHAPTTKRWFTLEEGRQSGGDEWKEWADSRFARSDSEPGAAFGH